LLSLIESLHDKYKAFEDGKKKKKILAHSVRLAALGCQTKTVNKKRRLQCLLLEIAPVRKKIPLKMTVKMTKNWMAALFLRIPMMMTTATKMLRKKRNHRVLICLQKGMETLKREEQKKGRISVRNEHNARAASLEESLSEQNRLIAKNNKQKNDLEKRRLTMEELANGKKFELEDRRLKLEENRAEAEKEERAMNREMMMSMIRNRQDLPN
jgi:hypothetical protein